MYKKKISSLLAAVIVAGMVTGSMPVCVNAQVMQGQPIMLMQKMEMTLTVAQA